MEATTITALGAVGRKELAEAAGAEACARADLWLADKAHEATLANDGDAYAAAAAVAAARDLWVTANERLAEVRNGLLLPHVTEAPRSPCGTIHPTRRGA